MQPFRPGSDGDGRTVLDREIAAAVLSGLRAAVLETASAAGLSDDRAIDVMLALHELSANVIRHGQGRGRLLMEVTPQALRCLISDTGITSHHGYLAAGADAEAASSWPVQHGHGLWLVRRTADQVQVTSGPAGSVVCVIFTLPGGGNHTVPN